MNKISLLIADSDPVLLSELSKNFAYDNDFNLVGTADNGKDAFQLIEKHNPNVVLFDLFLSYYDGFSLIEQIRNDGILNLDTKYVMSTPKTSSELTSESFRRGIDYVLTKPYDIKSLSKKLKRIYTIMNSSVYKYGEAYEPEDIISLTLTNLGIPANLVGYKYMVTAINEVIKNPDMLDGITKILYPEVAKIHNSTPQRVEKAIRHAIEVAWSQSDGNKLRAGLNFILRDGKLRPTNSEFLAVISRQLKTTA